MTRDPKFLEIELTDEEAPFSLWPPAPKPMDADRRLESWALACAGGATNVITVDGVSYNWDTRPRRLQNGSLQGRIYAQRRGELCRDIGGFKIDARGRVLQLSEVLRQMLPGGADAQNGESHGC